MEKNLSIKAGKALSFQHIHAVLARSEFSHFSLPIMLCIQKAAKPVMFTMFAFYYQLKAEGHRNGKSLPQISTAIVYKLWEKDVKDIS